MAYLACKFKYNIAEIIRSYETMPASDPDAEFITGDIAGGHTSSRAYYNFGVAAGTTTTSDHSAGDYDISVGSTAGMVAGENCAIELDNGLRHVAHIENIPSSTLITLSVGLTSASASGKNAVTSSQLNATTDGTRDQDFKVKKANQIIGKTEELMETGYTYKGRLFPLNGVNQPEMHLSILFGSRKDDRESADLAITNISQGNPAIATVSSIENVRAYDNIEIDGVVGMTELNGNTYAVGSVTGNSFELWQPLSFQHIDSTGFTAYASGGTCVKQEACKNQPLLDTDGRLYSIQGNSDFDNIARVVSTRRAYIFGPTGQTGLIAQVSTSANTQAAMDAILDQR